MNLYLVKYFKESRVVEAESTKEAIDLLFDAVDRERKEEGIGMDFDPYNFEISKLGYRSILSKESE